VTDDLEDPGVSEESLLSLETLAKVYQADEKTDADSAKALKAINEARKSEASFYVMALRLLHSAEGDPLAKKYGQGARGAREVAKLIKARADQTAMNKIIDKAADEMTPAKRKARKSPWS
jgi:hypothetical protein